MALPFIGSKISLISKSDIRYEGILYTIDTEKGTVALSNVRSFGTEDRNPTNPVTPSKEVYEFIIFPVADIKDLTVCEAPIVQGGYGQPFAQPYPPSMGYGYYPSYPPQTNPYYNPYYHPQAYPPAFQQPAQQAPSTQIPTSTTPTQLQTPAGQTTKQDQTPTVQSTPSIPSTSTPVAPATTTTSPIQVASATPAQSPAGQTTKQDQTPTTVQSTPSIPSTATPVTPATTTTTIQVAPTSATPTKAAESDVQSTTKPAPTHEPQQSAQNKFNSRSRGGNSRGSGGSHNSQTQNFHQKPNAWGPNNRRRGGRGSYYGQGQQHQHQHQHQHQQHPQQQQQQQHPQLQQQQQQQTENTKMDPFDFEASNARFDKEKYFEEQKGHPPAKHAENSENAATQVVETKQEEPATKAKPYDKVSSFFDSISCDALERLRISEGDAKETRRTSDDQRKLDSETFGERELNRRSRSSRRYRTSNRYPPRSNGGSGSRKFVGHNQAQNQN